MKVVLFCGGRGLRMRQSTSDTRPKPIQLIGRRPLLWHVMRYYAHFGHTEFILCLGYGAQSIMDYFDSHPDLVGDWRINFVRSGVDTPIGERLRRVRHHVEGDELFLANYADVVTDAPLDHMIAKFRSSGAAASLLAVPPPVSFHCVEVGADGMVSQLQAASQLPMWVNGGYFVLTPEIFDHLPEGGDLVQDCCTSLAEEGRLLAQPFTGFWRSVDTVKERIELDAQWRSGAAPWALWNLPGNPSAEPLGADLKPAVWSDVA